MNPQTGRSSSTNLGLILLAIFLICAYDLYEVAFATGNFRGMWFSIAHMALVAVGSWYALRAPGQEPRR
jgi:hypothetical protein